MLDVEELDPDVEELGVLVGDVTGEVGVEAGVVGVEVGVLVAVAGDSVTVTMKLIQLVGCKGTRGNPNLGLTYSWLVWVPVLVCWSWLFGWLGLSGGPGRRPICGSDCRHIS
jgi:hypothetical protein